jgi:hypothetical protein
MRLRLTGRQYSLRVHLLVFGAGILLPVAVLAGALLVRAAALERAQLETRLIQVAENLADDIDRDIARDFTLLQTLATMPSLSSEDWPAFYDQAKAALQGRAYVVVIDNSLRQLVNTFVPYGSQPSLTGDPDTGRRMIATKQPDVSDVFVSLVTKRPVFNVNIPILRDGEVRTSCISANSPTTSSKSSRASDWPLIGPASCSIAMARCLPDRVTTTALPASVTHNSPMTCWLPIAA